MHQRLGQHFLKDPRIRGVIAREVPVREGSIIVEIGPGHGELTHEIIDRFVGRQIKKWRFVAIEKDRELAAALRAEYKNLSQFEVVTGDVRDELPKMFSRHRRAGNLFLVGNIPYYLTGQLFTMISKATKKPDIVLFTIQKEVAERLVSDAPSMNPRTHTDKARSFSQLIRNAAAPAHHHHRTSVGEGMNRLAAAVRFWGSPEMLLYVPRSAFRPEPKVDSAVVLIRKKRSTARDFVRYEAMLQVLFRQPRKTIFNNINDAVRRKKPAVNRAFIEKALAQEGVNPSDRPATLSVEKIAALSKKFSRK